MLYDLLLAKSLNGGGGGGSAAPLFVEFASDDDWNQWDAQGYYEFQNLTCSVAPASIAAAIAEGRAVYATFTDSHNFFNGCVLALNTLWKGEDGNLNDVVFGRDIFESDVSANVMRLYRLAIDVYEDEDDPSVWRTSAELHYCWVEAYTT